MLQRNQVLEFLRENHQLFKSDYRICKIGLIGSFARNEQTEQSDIDLLVEFEPETDQIFEKKLQLKALFRAEFDREVDLCRERYMKPYIKEYLLRDVIYV